MSNEAGASSEVDFQRFLDVQGSVYPRALAEIRAGEKRSHWMWFIFPQIAGLGASETSRRYALSGLAAARAYLAHPVLGSRIRECVDALLDQEGRTAAAIFGYPDDLKLHSSLTLFAEASAAPAIAEANEADLFRQALSRYFGGQLDEATMRLLNR